MRILHIMASHAKGGAETYAAEVIEGLHREGVDQCVVLPATSPYAARLVQAGVRLATSPLDLPFHILQRLAIQRLTAKEKPDIVQGWMRRAASLAPNFAGPVVGWISSYQHPKGFARCGHLVGMTQHMADALQEKGRDPATISIIPALAHIDPAPAADRSALGTPSNAPLLLVLARLHPQKGVDTALRALALLPNCYLWIAGEGDERKSLEALTRELGIENRVRFLGWRNDRAALLAAADICLVPSREESFGLVLLEAFALAKPVAACAAPGPRLLITHGITGMLSPIEDFKALAENIKALADDKALRQRIGSAAQSLYQKNYTREAVAKSWVALYQRLRADRDHTDRNLEGLIA